MNVTTVIGIPITSQERRTDRYGVMKTLPGVDAGEYSPERYNSSSISIMKTIVKRGHNVKPNKADMARASLVPAGFL